MQIVIDISEEDYETMKHNVAIGRPICSLSEDKMVSKIVNGIPLPKGHGDLIDKNKLSKKKQYLFQTDNGAFPKSEWFIKADDLFSAKAIVEADKEKTKEEASPKGKRKESEG